MKTGTVVPILAVLLTPMAASAQPATDGQAVPRSAITFTGQPAVFFPTGTAYEVTGYRSATFGMTEDQVRAVIVTDFGPRDVETLENPVEGTRVLRFTVDNLPPVGTQAFVSYVFGRSSKRLLTVNTVWETPKSAGAETRDLLIRGAASAAGDLVGHTWKLFSTALGLPMGPDMIIVFAGADESDRGVEVRLSGVQSTWHTADGRSGLSPAPSGPAILRIAYTASVKRPDVNRLPPGSF
jgi:hypothetical protein